ncbi:MULTISPECIES: MOSC and FAD-binding oxidoreductase domain-containing protein [Nocardia]|uniref:MOSC and FAD-binding oxidoreductase domain-containing protein n=1 Tax=Nocardia TaxID=1817 RepID=UPI000D6954B8|nr:MULTISPECIES: MOSC and FAD-binding oxidoreductase domain-containing protein [Nocardia]
MQSLLSVNVGMPKDHCWQGRTVHTGVWKYPQDGPVMVRRLNIDGDGQGDTAGHGGEQRAVLVYQIQSYRYWQRHFGRDDFEYGQFGENLTVDGLADDEVCIGDRYRIGEAEFEVTQPRVTCYRVGLRLDEPEMPALLVSHHRPGFYMRVIREGHIRAGDPIVRTRIGPGAMSVADIDALLYLSERDTATLRRATSLTALSPGWQGSFRELLATAEASGTTVGPAWPGFRALRVTKVVPESATVSSIHLTTPDGVPLPNVPAGQYLTLRLPGAGTPAPVRSYSLSTVSDNGGYRISVKHEPHGSVSTYLTTRIRPGDTVDAAAPRGDFVLDDDTGPVLLVSAGIGLTPVLAMLHELAVRDSDREIWWIHGARRPREHPLAAEAHALLASLPHGHEHVFYSAETPAESGDTPTASGRLTADKLIALSIPAAATAYVCGPTSFMSDMRQALTASGLDPARIHSELFGTLAPVNPGIDEQAALPPHQPSGPPGTGPLVTFARSGLSVPYPDDEHSVLDLADACDVPSRWSCRTGVCHTCTTTLLAGAITYRPAPLEAPPDGEVLICCARPDTDIVLDM